MEYLAPGPTYRLFPGDPRLILHARFCTSQITNTADRQELPGIVMLNRAMVDQHEFPSFERCPVILQTRPAAGNGLLEYPPTGGSLGRRRVSPLFR